MKRRNFIATLFGAVLAPKASMAPALPPIGSFRGCLTLGKRAAQLEALQNALQLGVSSAWSNRYREAFNAKASEHPADPVPPLGPERVDG